MRISKKDEPDETPEQEELVRQVDAMMDPKLPDQHEDVPKPPDAPQKSEQPEPPEKPEPVKVKTSRSAPAVKTAPELPSAGKKIEVSAVPAAAAKPLSIDKLDQLTKSIASEDDTAEKAPNEHDDDDHGPGVAGGQGDDDPAKKDPETSGAVTGPDLDAQSTDLDDARTDSAVDDIVAHEGDVMLAVADATAAERNRESAVPERSHGLSNLVWFLVALLAALAIAISVLVITGGSLNLHGL